LLSSVPSFAKKLALNPVENIVTALGRPRDTIHYEMKCRDAEASPRKGIIALMPHWKKPTETEKKLSPSGAD
jgi:hypothetical protein